MLNTIIYMVHNDNDMYVPQQSMLICQLYVDDHMVLMRSRSKLIWLFSFIFHLKIHNIQVSIKNTINTRIQMKKNNTNT